ncbi:MAG: LapA family protein [Calditrichia bacterium]|nr:LapA family protein [Calditrichia bacterium]
MKIVMNIFNIFVLFVLFYLLIINLDEVNIHLVSRNQISFENVPVNLIILASTAFGALLGVLLTTFSLFKQKNEMRIIKKKNRQLKQELDNLRNISVEEIPDDIIEEPTQHEEESRKILEEPKQLNGGNE